MPSFNVTLHHGLSRCEARRRVDALIHELERRYGGRFDQVESNWEDNDLTFRCARSSTTVSGRVAVGGRTLHPTVQLPLSLALIAARLRQQFEQEGHRLLGS